MSKEYTFKVTVSRRLFWTLILSLLAGICITVATYDLWPKNNVLELPSGTSCGSSVNTTVYGLPWWFYREVGDPNLDCILVGTDMIQKGANNFNDNASEASFPADGVVPVKGWRYPYLVADVVLWSLVSFPIVVGVDKLRRRYG